MSTPPAPSLPGLAQPVNCCGPIITSIRSSGYNDFCTRDNGGVDNVQGAYITQGGVPAIQWFFFWNTYLTFIPSTGQWLMSSDCLDLTYGGAGTVPITGVSVVGNRVVGSVTLPTSKFCMGCVPNDDVTFTFS